MEMALTRRQALKSAGAAVAAAGIAKPAIAQKNPILIGYLPALTGPSSSTGVGINRGVQMAVDEINKAGGVDGHQLELISRDTQSDPTGYGTASANAYGPMLKQIGAEVVYQAHVDAANPDLKPEVLRMQSAGAEAIMPWSVNAGFLSRLINTRGQLAWDVPICGQTTLGSGQTKALLDKPEYWAKVYPNNFRPVCYGPDGKLPERTRAFRGRLGVAKGSMRGAPPWW